MRRSGTGPALARLAYSTDGTTWIDNGFDFAPHNGSCATPTATDTTQAVWNFCTTGTTIYFRIYPYNASGGGGTFQVFGLDIAGSVVSSSSIATPVISPAGTVSFCPGFSSTLSTVPVVGGTYQWYNGTSAISGATNSSYAATTAGNYYLQLTSSASCADTSNHVTAVVDPAPTAAVTTGSSATFCTPGSVVLTETSGTGSSYQWYNAAGPIAGATNSSYTATTTGRDSVIISNSYGCADTSAAVVVTAHPTPAATITPAGPVAICAGSTTTLTASFGAGYTYQWYNSTGIIAGATNATHVVNAAGRDSVVITSAAGCSATSAAVVVSLNPVPDATTTASGPLSYCSYDSVTLTATAGAGYTFQWYSTGAIGGATNISYTVHSSGTYHVKVTNSSGCTANSSNFTVTVNAAPSTAVTYSGPVTFCTGGSETINADATAGDTYQWYDATGPIAGATNASYTSTVSADLYAIVTSAAGCTSTTVTSHVTEAPPPAITPTGSTTVCSGNSVLLTASTAGAIGVVYQWMKNGIAIMGATNATYVATSTGLYTCLIDIAPGCAATTLAIPVTINPAPTPVVYSDGAQHMWTDSNYATYQWYLNTVAITGATTYHIVATEIGSYRVLVSDTNSCPGLSADHNVYWLAVDDVNAYEAVSIYPNPATSVLHIASAHAVHTVISSIAGKAILDSREAVLDVSQLPAGIYVVTVYDGDGKRLLIDKLTRE